MSAQVAIDTRRVLVIDAAFRPINVVGLKRALTKIFAGRAEPIEFSRDGAVLGKLRVPAVIQLGAIINPHRQRVRFCRKNVLVGRDRGICQYCTRGFPTEDLTLDHVIPRGQGGQTTWENVVASCIACNQRKANRTPAQAGMVLRRAPVRPRHIIEVKVRMDDRGVPEEWKDYWVGTLQT